METFPTRLLTQGQGPFPQVRPQSLGNTLPRWGVCVIKRLQQLVSRVLGNWPGSSGPPMYSGASCMNMRLEFPLTAPTRGEPATTNPKAQDTAPESCWPQTQGYHLCFSEMQPPPVPRTLRASEVGSLVERVSVTR